MKIEIKNIKNVKNKIIKDIDNILEKEKKEFIKKYKCLSCGKEELVPQKNSNIFKCQNCNEIGKYE